MTATRLIVSMVVVAVGCGGRSPAGGGPKNDAAVPGSDAPVGLADGAADRVPDADSPEAGSGSDGSVAVTTAQYRACVTYFRAQCNRSRVCGGGTPHPDPCPTVTDSCPDSEFAVGSARTVDSLLDCASAWANFPCAEREAGKFPDCAGIPGSLPAGARCTGDLQCATTYCAGGTNAQPCGMCKPRVPSGGACVAYLECPRDEHCPAGTCTKIVPDTPRVPLGGACSAASICAAPNYCLPAGGAGFTCQPLPKLGDACDGLLFCENSSLCTSAKRCEAAPTAGMPCKRDASLSRFMCDDTSICDEAAPNGPTCRPRTAAGGACLADARWLEKGSCLPDLVCACVDVTCATGKCMQRRQEGDACGDPNGLCVPGTTCVAGRCGATFQETMQKRCGA